MKKQKLRLDDIEVVSFETMEAGEEQGTVQANMAMVTADVRTCRGQTILCTACAPYQCGARY